MFSNFSFFENRAVCEIMWENIVEQDENTVHAYCMLNT